MDRARIGWGRIEMTTLFFPVDPFIGVTGSDYNGLVTALNLLSHLPYLLAGALNQARGSAFLAEWCYIELVVSLVYHACRGGIYCFGLPSNFARFDDHVCANSLVGALALHLIQYDLTRGVAGQWARTLLPVVALVAVSAWPFQLQSALLVFAYIMLVVAYRFLIEGALVPPRRERFVIKWLLLGVVFVMLACLTYVYNTGDPGGASLTDGLLHALWHLLGGLALLALSAAVVSDDQLQPAPNDAFLVAPIYKTVPTTPRKEEVSY